jgi:hypothetical protein
MVIFCSGDKKIQEGIKDKDVEDMYERLMSPLNNLFKMSLFFCYWTNWCNKGYGAQGYCIVPRNLGANK